MKKNVGTLDTVIRTIMAVVAFYIAYLPEVNPPWNYVLYAIGSIFIVTGVLGKCPIYSVLGINSCKTKNE